MIQFNIIIFNEQSHSTINAIKDRLVMFINYNIIVITDYAEFKDRFTSCLAGECIIIFFINNEKDMVFLELMKKYFMDIKLIIYLSFENKDIISRAYAMYPRMVISDDSSKELLPAVIEKIAKNLIKQ